MLCNRCKINEVPNVFWMCNPCREEVGALYRIVQRPDGTWEEVRTDGKTPIWTGEDLVGDYFDD